MKTKKQLFCMFYVVATTFATKVLWKEGDLNVGYDFESQQGLENILGKNVCKDVFLVSNFQKHGNFSLLWKWKNKKQLHIDLKQQLKKVSTLRKACGIYFWIYQRKPIKGKLKVTLQNPSNETYHFDVNLHFKNWRAVARTFQVSEKKFLTGFDSLIFEVNIKSSAVHHGKIYFDLIRLSSRCIGWSYDTVNPPQIPLKLGLVNDVGGTENLNGFYEENHFWQSTYKWWKVDRNATSKIDAQTPLSSEEKQLIDELKVVEKSVDNWYYPTGKVVSSLDKYSQQKLKSLFQCSERNSTDRFLNIVKNYKKESYPSIRKKMFFTKNGQHDVCVRTAYEKYLELSTRQKHLFPSRDIFPYGRDDLLGMKFNEVNHHILFPLVLEFFISKQMREAEKIHSTTEDSRNVKEPTQKKYAPSFLFQNMEKLSTYTDRQRISLFTKTFRYLQTEGWDEGSSLGNTDHLLNLNEGYTQSIYLIRKELSGNKIFKRLLKAARWYNEIGEIHQMSFANKGTTADKGKNVLGRLLLILASPQKTTKEARQKILDAKRLKAWIENALEINEAYAGIIKPDFTGYHHKGVYMSVYSSEAIHALSIASYFLRGTSFAISEKYLSHLTEALKTLYLMSNSLAIPLGVSGAKLANSIVMHQLMPAFAYMSLAKSDFEVDKTMASIFLKLYDKSNPFVLYALEEGEADQSSRYFNSIGSVILMENLQRIAKLKNITSIKNPHGHWFFSFASLGLHRRKDWSVTVKGFSKFTWDFESLINQNVYGRFLSHGHLCITNGVSSLPDVFNGWDWNRIPGATTMEFELAELISHGESRYFTNKTSVGGSPFGEFQSEHGVFIMDFEQPKYESRFFRKNPNKFSFKKSFFFVDDIIVCLGSNIQQKGIKNRNVITTIFQEKLHLGGDIRLNGSNFSYPTDLVLNRSGYFLDGQSNGYVISDTNKNPVHLKIDLNTKSRRRNGELVKNPDIYASLVFQHGKEPVNESYEYVIQVATNEKRIHALAESISHHYEVMQKDSIAHIVRFKQLSITAYAIFDALNFVGDTSSHVIYSVNRASIVTIFDKGMYYFISVMDPDLRRFEKYISNSKYMNQKTFYGSRSQPGWLVISLNVQLSYLSAKCPESLKKTITIYEDVTIFGNVKPHIKLQLSHGHTCEMKFKKRSL